jgi:membrane fusion protein (multidrug efflux system)
MSVETAVAVSTPDNTPPTERGSRVGCSFDPSKDMVERTLTTLPEHPGLGRARPQGSSGMEVPISPPRQGSSAPQIDIFEVLVSGYNTPGIS